MEKMKKTVYEAPKVWVLDDREAVYGGVMAICEMGSNPGGTCFMGGGPIDEPNGSGQVIG